jgi:hypothetical protein
MTNSFTTEAQAAAAQAANLVDPLVAQGVIGVCLVALAVWYILKDRKYEKRIDELLARERAFGEKYAEQVDKYRVAMENVSKTLDVVVNMVKDR